jgi:hypothetical protein
VQQSFRRIDANRFTAEAYRKGKKVCRGSVGGSTMGSESIEYSMTDEPRHGGMNEAVMVGLPMHPALKNALLEWRTQSLYTAETDFVFPSLRRNGRKPLDLAAVLNRKIKPAFAKVGITGVGWHTFRHSVGSILANMGEHQLTIRDYLRHSTST